MLHTAPFLFLATLSPGIFCRLESARLDYLAARRNADDTRLQKLLAAALRRHGGQGLSGSMIVQRWPDGQYALHMCPVEPPDGTRGVPGLAAVAAVVLIVDPAARPSFDSERVSIVLGLTPAEGRVAAALAGGASVRDIAATIHRAESTVRWTIKRIHVKLNVTRQADIVRIVLSATSTDRPVGNQRCLGRSLMSIAD